MTNKTNSQIEERIVSMRFDNQQFEQGVKTTMSTLEKLKESLKFKNSVSGVESVQKNLNSINLNAAISGLDNFKVHMSGLEVFSKRIVENIADSVYKAIAKIKAPLTGVLNQIKTGGENRAQNIEQAKFQLNGLKIAWEDIEEDINYGVKDTAYGLDSAARIAAQLSASNVQIGEDMKAALRGISGVASMTNSSYDEIGRIFTQVAGAGRLYTQDMLQISSRGLNIAAALGNQLGKTESEIREMVTRGEIDFKMFATAMNDAFGDQAKKANDTYTGSLSNVKAALSRLGADIAAAKFEALRKIFVQTIPKLNEFKKSLEPAIKAISNLITVTGQFVEKIISRIDVKELGSNIAKVVEFVGGKLEWFIGQMSKMIDKIDAIENMTKAISKGSEMLSAREAHIKKIKEATDELTGSTEESAEAAKEMDENTQKALQAAQDIWSKGTYGNGQARIDALTAAGIDPKLTQKIIDEFIANGGDWEKAVQKIVEETKKADDATNGTTGKLSKKFENLARTIVNLKRIFKNVFTSVKNVVGEVFDVIAEAFGKKKKGGSGSPIVDFTEKVADLSDKFVITKEKAKLIRRPLTAIVTTLKKVGKVIGTIAMAIGGVIATVTEFIFVNGRKIARKLKDNTSFQTFKKSIEDIWSSLKKMFTDISESETFGKIKEIFETIGKVVGGVVTTAFEKVSKWTEKVSTKFKEITTNVGEFFDKVKSKFKGAIDKVKEFLETLYTDVKEGTVIDKVKEKIDKFFHPDSKDGKKEGSGKLKQIFDWLKSFIGGIIDHFTKLTPLEFLKEAKAALLLVAAVKVVKFISTLTGIFEGIPKMISQFTSALKAYKWNTIMQTVLIVAKILTQFAKAVFILVSAVVLMGVVMSLDPEIERNVWNAIGLVTDLMWNFAGSLLLLIGGVTAIKAASAKLISKIRGKFQIPLIVQFASFMAGLGMLINAIIKVSKMTPNDFATGLKRVGWILAAVTGFFLAIGGVNAILSHITKDNAGIADALGKLGWLMLAVSISVDILILGVGALALMMKGLDTADTSYVEKAVDSIKSIISTTLICIGLCLALARLGTKNDQEMLDGIKSLSKVFWAIGGSMILLAFSIGFLAIAYTLMPNGTTAAVLSIIGIIAAIGIVCDYVSKIKADDKAIKTLVFVIGMIDLLAWILSNVNAKGFDEAAPIAAIGLGITAILLSLSAVLDKIKQGKNTWKAYAALGGIILAIGGVVAACALLAKTSDENSWTAITATLLGIAVIFGALAGVFAVVTKLNNRVNFLKFGESMLMISGGIAIMVLSLALLAGVSNENSWKSIAAALGGIALIFAAIMGIFTAVKGLGQGFNFIGFGVGLGILSIGIAAIAAALGKFSNDVDIKGLWNITGALIALLAVFAGLTFVLAKFPITLAVIGEFILLLLATSLAVGVIIWAFDKFVKDSLPAFEEGIVSLVYTIGTLPGTFVRGIIDGFGEIGKELEETFEEIGGNIVGGFAKGLSFLTDNAFVNWVKDLFRKGSVEPAMDELDEHSPSKVFEMIGKYVGEGFQNGLSESFSNIDISSITGVKDTLQDGLGNIGDNLDFSVLTKNLGGADTDIFGSLGFDITNGITKSLSDQEGIDLTKYITLDDMIANENIYNLLKEAGETQLTAAYEAWLQTVDFKKTYSSFQKYMDNLATIYGEAKAQLINHILTNGTEEEKKEIEASLFGEWLDGRNLPEQFEQYKASFQKNLDETVQEIESGNANREANIPLKLVNSNAQELLDAWSSPKGITMGYEDSEVNRNMKAISDADNRSADVRMQDNTNRITDRLSAAERIAKDNGITLNQAVNAIGSLGNRIDGMQVRMDSGALVGSIITQVDQRLGQRTARVGRR